MRSILISITVATLSVMNTYAAPSDSSFPYFEKTGGSLDYMGVAVTRTVPTQRLWAPGTAEREYPGGWVTPGEYEITINTARVHQQRTGVHTGQLHEDASHQLMGRVISRPYNDVGWENHSFDAPDDVEPQEWGTARTVVMEPGDVLHVAYGNEVVPFQKRSGSDGIIVYCVATEPEPRAGLWGTAPDRSFDEELWQKLVDAVHANASHFTPSTSATYWGPVSITGTLASWTSDFGQNASDAYGNKMSGTLSGYLLNRAYVAIREGSMSAADRADLELLFEYYLNMVSHCFQWGDRSGQHYCMAHGIGRYPPYEAWGFAAALVAAVALDLDPTYEPLYNKLGMWGARPDMTLPHLNSYNYGNTGDAVVTALTQNAYTQWIINDLGLTDVASRGGHREAVWGIAHWARCMLAWPETPFTQEHLWKSGYGVKNYGLEPWAFCGHEWNPDGSAAGHNLGYGQMEHNGAAWLWFTGLERHTEHQRYVRRNWFMTTFRNDTDAFPGIPRMGGYWMKSVFATWLDEVTGLEGSAGASGVSLVWDANDDVSLSGYRVYRGTDVRDITTVVADGVSGTSYDDTGVAPNTTYYYAVAAVDADGNEGSRSDADTVTTGTVAVRTPLHGTSAYPPLHAGSLNGTRPALYRLDGRGAAAVPKAAGVYLRVDNAGALKRVLMIK